MTSNKTEERDEEYFGKNFSPTYRETAKLYFLEGAKYARKEHEEKIERLERRLQEMRENNCGCLGDDR